MPHSSVRQSGLDFFATGDYESASRALLAALFANPAAESWNDWAAAEAACGRLPEALRGFQRALTLDPHNQEARANFQQLQATATPSLNVLSSQALPSPTNELTDPVLLEIARAYFRDLASIPSFDPTLAPEMREALRRSNSDSSYFVNESYRKLVALPPVTIPVILQQLEQRSSHDYRYFVIAALHAAAQSDWPHALTLLRSAADLNWADLFVERERIRCETLRHRDDPTQPNTFAGLTEYLAQSFCPVPWQNMEITSTGTTIEQTGEVYFCCPAWMPIVAGNARLQSAEAIWNSPVAHAMRQSILDGSFHYCSKVHCNFISGRRLPARANAEELYPVHLLAGPSKISLSYDRSCNLACPSCRSDFYSAPPRQQDEMQRTYGAFVKNAAQSARLIYMDGAGETFASKHSRAVLKSLNRREYPHLKFQILTNGQLFDQRAYLEFDLRDRLARVDISIDATRPETYAIIRKGGQFSRLLANLEFLDNLRQHENQNFLLTFRYVISSLNYQEMPEVVRIGRQFHLDIVEFAVMRQWGHLSPDAARDLFIANPEHPLHNSFVEVLQSPEFDDPIVDLGSALEYRKVFT